MVRNVYVKELPVCDICKIEGCSEPAEYDGKTIYGPWANMCEEHFRLHGVGLGTGRGQRLIKTDAEYPCDGPKQTSGAGNDIMGFGRD